jgi:hypothetical protein
VRVLQEPGGEAFVTARLVVSEHAWDEPTDRLDDHKGSELSAREHEVAEGHLTVDEVVGDALVDSLIPAAQEAEATRFGQLSRHGLVETAASWREQQEGSRRIEQLHGTEDRLGSQHHAGSTAERGIVHGSVGVTGGGTQVVHADVDVTVTPCSPEDARFAVGIDSLREDREDVNPQAAGIGHSNKPSGTSTTS